MKIQRDGMDAINRVEHSVMHQWALPIRVYVAELEKRLHVQQIEITNANRLIERLEEIHELREPTVGGKGHQ
jgi:hypothetical protein